MDIYPLIVTFTVILGLTHRAYTTTSKKLGAW